MMSALEAKAAAAGEQASAQLSAIAGVWDDQHLRSGDHLNVSGRPRPRHDSGWSHANQWHPNSVLRLAFSLIGKQYRELGLKTRRDLDAISCVALSHVHRQRECLKDFKMRLSAGVEKSCWIILQRAFDGTPCEVQQPHVVWPCSLGNPWKPWPT